MRNKRSSWCYIRAKKRFLTADCRVIPFNKATVCFFFFFLCITFSLWQKSLIYLDIPADSVGVNYLRRQSASAPTTFDSSTQTFKERLSSGGSGSDVGGCEATYEWAYVYYSAIESGLRIHANMHAEFIDMFVLCKMLQRQIFILKTGVKIVQTAVRSSFCAYIIVRWWYLRIKNDDCCDLIRFRPIRLDAEKLMTFIIFDSFVSLTLTYVWNLNLEKVNELESVSEY